MVLGLQRELHTPPQVFSHQNQDAGGLILANVLGEGFFCF